MHIMSNAKDRRMYKAVGKTFKFEGKKLLVVEVADTDECTGCYFERMDPCGAARGYFCTAHLREDRKNVIFAEIE